MNKVCINKKKKTGIKVGRSSPGQLMVDSLKLWKGYRLSIMELSKNYIPI